MIAWESYGNRWRLHPGVADTITRAIRDHGLATMCRRIGVHPVEEGSSRDGVPVHGLCSYCLR